MKKIILAVACLVSFALTATAQPKELPVDSIVMKMKERSLINADQEKQVIALFKQAGADRTANRNSDKTAEEKKAVNDQISRNTQEKLKGILDNPKVFDAWHKIRNRKD